MMSGSGLFFTRLPFARVPFAAQTVHRFARHHGAFLRFLIFLAVCSFGYAAITLGCAALLKIVLTINRGALMAPIALGILIAIGIIAERQREL